VSHGTQLFIEAVKREALAARATWTDWSARASAERWRTRTSGKRIAVSMCEGEVFL